MEFVVLTGEMYIRQSCRRVVFTLTKNLKGQVAGGSDRAHEYPD